MSEEKANNDSEEKKEYTPEELEQMKVASIKSYKDQTEVLEAQIEYETKLADLAEQRERAAKARAGEVYALYAAQGGNMEPDVPEDPKEPVDPQAQTDEPAVTDENPPVEAAATDEAPPVEKKRELEA